MKGIAGNIFETIGNTPLLRLNRVTRGLKTEIVAKLEYFNPSGSLKDRILFRMVEAAEQEGKLKQGMTIIEGTTGNTGIATAMTAAAKGYPCIIVMPEGMSKERHKTVQAYGARLVLTPGGESDVDLVLEKVQEIMASAPGKYWRAGQFDNPQNPQAHYLTTGPEIWEQTSGQLDTIVASQGTGGIISGTSRFLREKNKNLKVFAVEPAECPLLAKRTWGPHLIEGIGDGFIPRVLDVSILSGIVLTTSQEAIDMAKRLAREEGVFCGISSGCNVAAAIKVAKKHPELKRIVTIIPDNGLRYFSTELCGEEVHLDVPERGHPIDEHTLKLLDKYQKSWEIIE
ncbi:MAG: cysteine synthase A [Deinococcus sp.]|nr:cysteine synthase A [Deinococcus sp.]